MSGHRYTTSTNPFDADDDDIDDETFLASGRRLQPPSSTTSNHFDAQVHSLKERRQHAEERTIASTERSIGILRDSEQIGIATAEELVRQREQLERTDKRLDEINQTLRFSQKHINGIKSVFSSLKNYMAGGRTAAPSSKVTQVTPSSSEPQLFNSFDTHPVTRLKSDPAGQQAVPSAGGSKHISQQLEANLHEMSSSISRLKGLATDLSVEIDAQNDLITDITEKTESADFAIQAQNKDMNKLLGRK